MQGALIPLVPVGLTEELRGGQGMGRTPPSTPCTHQTAAREAVTQLGARSVSAGVSLTTMSSSPPERGASSSDALGGGNPGKGVPRPRIKGALEVRCDWLEYVAEQEGATHPLTSPKRSRLFSSRASA